MKSFTIYSAVSLAVVLAFISASPVIAAEPAKIEKTSATATQSHDIHVGVNGMVCDFCAQTLKKTFAKKAGIKKVDISLEDKMVTLHLQPDQKIDDAKIRELISDAGYAVTNIHRM